MSGILVFAEHDGTTFKKTAFELLGKATELGAALGKEVAAAVLGDIPAAELGSYGAVKVYQVAGDFSAYSTLRIAAALAAIAKAVDPDVILAPASTSGKDAIPRLVARLDGAQASDCTEIKVVGGQIVARRPVYSGKAYVDVRLSARPAVYTVRPNSFPKPAPTGAAAAVVAVAVVLPADPLQIVRTTIPETKAVDLTEAERIVAGGRALKSKDDFDRLIRPLAGAIRATPGASRAAVDAGYAPHGDQVGQTGKTVNPQLYVACGISGAIQHLAGMRTSKVIVAINKDPEAPIFEHATYGIVDDVFKVCPALQAELAKLVASA